MRIQSVSLRNVAPFGDFSLNFRAREVNGQAFTSVSLGTDEAREQFLNCLKLLFGLPCPVTDFSALLATPGEKAAVEAHLKEGDEEFTLLLSVEPQPESLQPLVVHQLRNAKEVVLHSDLKGIQRELFRKNDFLTDLLELVLSSGSSTLKDFYSNNPLTVQKQICRYLAAFQGLELPAIVNHLLSHESGHLEDLKKQLESLAILHDGAEALNRSDLDAQRQRLETARAQLNETKDAIDWTNRILFLKEEVTKLLKEEHELGVEIDRFAMKRPVLDNALRAIALAPHYETIRTQIDAISGLRKKQSDLMRTVPMLREKAKNSQASAEAAEHHMQTVERRMEEDRAVIARVRELEEEIARERTQLEEKVQAATLQQTQISSFTEEINKLKNRVSDATQRQKNLQKKMSDQDCDDALTDNLDEYKRQLLLIDSSQIQIDRMVNEQKDIQRQIEANKGFLSEINSDLTKLRKEESLTRADCQLKEKEAAKLLGNDSEEALRTNLSAILERIGLIHLIQDKTNELLGLNQRIDEDKKVLDKSLFALKLATLKHKTATQSLKDKLAVVDAAQETLNFQKEILRYEKERTHLANGKPCPLCGAVHHPFASSLTIDNKAQQRLDTATQEASAAKAADDSAALEERLASNECEEIQARIDSQTQSAADLTQFLIQKSLEADIPGLKGRKPSTWPAVIRQRLSLAQTHLTDNRGKIEKFDAVKANIQQIQAQLHALLERITLAKEQSERTTAALDEEGKSLQRALSEEAQARTQRDELVRTLERVFQKYGLNSTTLSQLKQSFLILEKRSIAWQGSKEEEARLSEEIQKDQAQLDMLSAGYDRESQVLAAITAETDTVQDRIRTLTKDRTDLFGNQHTDEEEQKLALLLKSASDALNDAEDVNTQRQHQLQAAEEEIVELDERITHEQTALSQLQEEFNAMLSENGFKSESAFLAARITDSQREALQAQSNLLADKRLSITERKSGKEEELQREEALQKTHKSRSELDAEAVTLKAQITESEKNIAVLEDKLEKNERTKQLFNRIKERKDRVQRLVEHLEGLRNASKAARSEEEKNAVFLSSLARLVNEELTRFSSSLSVEVAHNTPIFEVHDRDNPDFVIEFARLSAEEQLFLLALTAQACLGLVPGSFEFFPLFIRTDSTFNPEALIADFTENIERAAEAASFAVLS